MEFVSNQKNFSLEEIEGGFFWRYLDIFQLISFLESNTIYFSRADKFEDITECLSNKGFSEIYLGETYQKISNPTIFESIGKTKSEYQDEGNRAVRQELEKAKEAQLFHFVSCWHFAKRESIAMWKQYSKEKGFALKIPAINLFKAIEKGLQEKPPKSDWIRMTYGFVNYRKLTPFDHRCDKNKAYLNDSNTFLGYNKDESYEHEKEFRFIATPKQDNHESFTMEIRKTIDTIKLIGSPSLKKWELDAANKAIAHITNTRIDKSSIYLRQIM